MPSQSAAKFKTLLQRAVHLSTQAGMLKKKHQADAKSIFLHAALATQVASWDAYVKALASEYFSVTADPSQPRFNALHTICDSAMIIAKDKLNTPNSENTREFFLKYTAFDPWPCWAGVRFGTMPLSSTLYVRERLNEIFKVRHSFAHGFTMPGYSWNQNVSGSPQLTCAILQSTSVFFSDLCRNTDKAMAMHIASQHGLPNPW